MKDQRKGSGWNSGIVDNVESREISLILTVVDFVEKRPKKNHSRKTHAKISETI